MFNLILGIIVILLILWHFGQIGSDASRAMTFGQVITSMQDINPWKESTTEGLSSCADCGSNHMPKNGMVVLNPFIYPYSGTADTGDLYMSNKIKGLDLGFHSGPLTNLNTPDHVELSN